MPRDSESVMDYWIRLNKAIDVADECLRRRGKGVEDPSAEVVMMFICHCPDPGLAVYFQFKPVELWTAAEVQERLDGHVRSLRSTAACAQHAVNISTCTHESTVPAPHCGMQHQLPVVVTPPLVSPTPATACAPVPSQPQQLPGWAAQSLSSPLCLLLMRTSSRLPLCLTRFCLFALHHWLMQAKHLTSPRPTPASPGTLLAGQEAIPEGLNIPASSPALPRVCGLGEVAEQVSYLTREHRYGGANFGTLDTQKYSGGTCCDTHVGDRWIPVKVLNPTQRAITLRRNAKIADVFPCLAVEDLPITQGLCRSQCGLSDPPTASPRSAGDPVQLLKDCGLVDINVDGCEVSESCRRKLAELVLSYQDVFSRDKLDCGEAKEFVHRIRLSDDRPFRLPYRRVPPGHYQQLREVLSDMEMKGIISKSLSEYASPLVMVWKKNGDLRICTDFRWLNAKTIKDAHPLPHQADCLAALGGNALFSTMDLTSGFYNVPLHESDRKFTAFTTPMGLYEYNRLPQGLCNSPASFMRMMFSIFGDLNFSSLLCYLDDLLVFAPPEEEALRRLEVVFSRLRANNLKLSQKKCNFLRKSVRFLGHIVDASGVSVDQEKVAVISGFRKEDLMDADGCTPSQQKVRSFLGMVLYYQHFIPGCSTIAKPLFALTGGQKRKLKGSGGNRRAGTFRTLTPQDWDPACDRAFEDLGSALLHCRRLLSEPYSRLLEQVCSVNDSCVQDAFHVTCLPQSAENPSLCATGGMSLSEEEVSSLLSSCGDWDSGLKQRAASLAGHLSQLVPPGLDMFSSLSSADLQSHQRQDPTINRVLHFVERKQRPSRRERDKENQMVMRILKQWDKLTVLDGILYRVTRDPVTKHKRFQFVLPDSLKSQALAGVHDLAGHQGQPRTLSLVRQRFFWYDVEKDVRSYVRNCARCVLSKTPEPAARAPLESITTSAPLELVCIDFWSAEDNNNKSVDVLVITDHFTKLAHAFPCQDQTAKKVAKKLWDNFFCVYGFPQRLHSDQGANFQSELIAELLELAGVGQSRTSPYHPMGNGGTERFNRTLGGMLRSLPPRSKHKWPQMIQTMTFTYNCTQHETTGFAPFYLMFGRVPRLPVDLLFRNVLRDDCVCDYNAYVKSLATDLQSAMLLAQRHSSVEQKHQSDQYNKKVKGLPLSVGDRVLVANKSGRGKRKLADRWEPAVYTVVASKPQFHIYKIRDRDGQVRTVHRNLLLAVNFLPLDNTLFAEDDLRSVDTVSHDPSNVPDPEAAVSEPESVAEHSVVDSSSWLNVSERNRTASWVCDQSCTAEVESVNGVSVGRASSRQ
ncbi:hypothetical protein AAFF_G00291800 [Aldrovandia affinis]|uniref:Gypsy retrotransposon integrase-like protein 1 n=1 Tax=Aldrovandia affinis TaxID=143900 RepID=A0AAD7WSN4_9TELE|nr:hypothetical protein AAFF_G00291800 [Aldrovandia affinis]